MMNAILLWLWRKLTAYVEGALDPESAARAKAFEARVAAADARAKEAEQQYAVAEANRKQWEEQTLASIAKQAALRTQFEESEKAVTVLENEIVTIHQRAEEANARVGTRPDSERFGGVPKL